LLYSLVILEMFGFSYPIVITRVSQPDGYTRISFLLAPYNSSPFAHRRCLKYDIVTIYLVEYVQNNVSQETLREMILHTQIYADHQAVKIYIY
jgi:hypothetical protein